MIRTHNFLLFLLCYFKQWHMIAAGQQYKYLGKPGMPRWYEWAEGITCNHLTNMTSIIVKDMKVKLEHVRLFQDKYKGTMSYELGTIAASVQTYFTHMLQIYKTYSNQYHFVRQRYSRTNMLDAYQILQSDYSQIRHGRDMYFKALERHEEIRRERLKKLRKYSSGNPHEDEILKRYEQGQLGDLNKGRRSFDGNARLEPGSSDKAKVDLELPRQTTKKADVLPSSETRKPSVKKLWQPGKKLFDRESHLDG